ncbi:LysR substrate-binding domain-containing protein [Thalassotalea atypica]|uniref:LysR substrate-binding domain-containing protein n=1 Tax=Thalassotalea atypica TaxID=2054316 RepID=UPI0025742607|nr:LysR substrate-binding domain-containing protein [Thalassotalea atypica]
MDRLPPLRSLQVFLAVANSSSFKGAADSLFVSQAAVSQQIKLLEAHVGCKLFERSSTKMTLTKRGSLLLPFVAQAFEQVRQGISAVTFEPNANELRVTALHSVTSLLLIPNIDCFQQENPALSVQFNPNNLLDDFDEHNIDIAIRRGFGTYPNLESRKLVDDTIVLVANPLIVEGAGQHIDDIANLPLLNDTSVDIQEAVVHFKAKYHLGKQQLKPSLQTTDSVPVIDHALSGRGVAFVSRLLVAEHIKQGTLVNVLDYQFDSPRTLYLVAPAHHFTWKKVQLFEAWISKVLQALPKCNESVLA